MESLNYRGHWIGVTVRQTEDQRWLGYYRIRVPIGQGRYRDVGEAHMEEPCASEEEAEEVATREAKEVIDATFAATLEGPRPD